MPIRVLTAADVHAALPMPRAISAMREAFAQLADGRANIPARIALPVPHVHGMLLVMPGRSDLPHRLGGKLVSVFPENTEKGLPLIHACMMLLDPQTGAPKALLEGTTLTAIRTGAASGLATDLLARPEASVVAIIGAGVQARTQLEAVCSVRDITQARVFSRTEQSARAFATEMSGRGPIPSDLRVARSVRGATAGADIICVATTSSVPVLLREEVPEGCHVNAVGSFTPEMQELDPGLFAAARVVVDQRTATMEEAGEVIAAVQSGQVREEELVELGAIVNGTSPGRTDSGEVTVFKSVGVAIQDLAAADHALRSATREGLGTLVDL